NRQVPYSDLRGHHCFRIAKDKVSCALLRWSLAKNTDCFHPLALPPMRGRSGCLTSQPDGRGSVLK
ncbi:MAG TPA: hypothetical protein VI653_06855, partial [Steroidobacteraceae bacterium]